MPTCKEVSRLITESYYRKLSLRERIAVRTHLLYCKWCARYHRQLHWLRTALRQFLEEIENTLDQRGPALSDEARERIKQSLRSM